jgi:hypothetical protein
VYGQFQTETDRAIVTVSQHCQSETDCAIVTVSQHCQTETDHAIVTVSQHQHQPNGINTPKKTLWLYTTVVLLTMDA